MAHKLIWPPAQDGSITGYSKLPCERCGCIVATEHADKPCAADVETVGRMDFGHALTQKQRAALQNARRMLIAYRPDYWDISQVFERAENVAAIDELLGKE